MRRMWMVGLIVAESLATAGGASAVDSGSSGCQDVNSEGTFLATSRELYDGSASYFAPGEVITISADFSPGTGAFQVSVKTDGAPGGAWTSQGWTNTESNPSWSFPIPYTYTAGLYVLSGNGEVQWTWSCAPAVDTDNDGFPDALDNFPTVYSKCRTSQATVIGTPGNDNPLNGTEDPDVIMGFGGADVIFGLGGDDLICAGNGADTVYGGDGKDKIYGENGADTIYGNEKSDRLYGGDNDDVILGGDGTRDRLYGGAGVNDLDGGAGDDDRCTLGPTFNRCEVTT